MRGKNTILITAPTPTSKNQTMPKKTSISMCGLLEDVDLALRHASESPRTAFALHQELPTAKWGEVMSCARLAHPFAAAVECDGPGRRVAPAIRAATVRRGLAHPGRGDATGLHEQV